VPRAAAGREADALPLVRIPPEYPPGLLQRGVEGFVVVRHWVGVRGEVTRAEVVQAYPRHAFERAALEAVYRWRYRPGESGGATVVRGPIEVLLEFSIEDAQR
jgi:protein TonB